MKKGLNVILFLLGWPLWLVCQVSIVPLEAPETLVACGDAGDFRLLITNADDGEFTSGTLLVSLPTGMFMVPGSATDQLSAVASPDPQLVEFSLASLPGNTALEVGFSTFIDCAFMNNEVLSYELTIDGETVTAEEQPLANFFYPEVVITDVDAPVLDIAVNGTGNRTFSIIQSTPGARLDSLFLVHTYEPGLQPLSTSIGTALGSGPSGDTLVIAGAELPGNDGFFDFGDTLMLTQWLQLLSCTPINSSIELFWRCGAEVCQNFVLNTLITPAYGAPDLRITNTTGFASQSQANDPAQVGGGFCDTLELSYRIENLGEEAALGAGTLFDLVIGLGFNSNLFGGPLPQDIGQFPNWSIQVLIDNTIVPQSNYAYPDPDPLLGFNVEFSSLPADPDGAGGLSDADGDGMYDDLAVGASTTLRVQIMYDPMATPDCTILSGFPNQGGGEANLRLGYAYQDQCALVNTYWYGVNDPGINIVSLFEHREVTYSAGLGNNNLEPGESTTLTILPDGAWTSPCAATDSILLEVILPDGLIGGWTGSGPGTFHGVVAQSGDTVWLAASERGSLMAPWELSVSLDCSAPVVDSTLQVSFLYFCSPDCGPAVRIDCQEISLDYIAQCELCPAGLETSRFTAERVSLGWEDVFHTQQVDPQTRPTVNLGAAINYDSVLFRLEGVFQGGDFLNTIQARIDYQSIDPDFVDPTVPHFTILDGTLHYFTANQAPLSCPLSALNSDYNPSSGLHSIYTELAALWTPGACLDGIPQLEGDSMVVEIMTLVTDNVPRQALPVPELAGSFVWDNGGEESSCNRYLENLVLEEVIPAPNLAYAPQIHFGCEAIAFHNNSITNRGHVFDGDQFPDEVRTIADVSEVRIILEGAWAIEPGSASIVANGSFNQNNALSDLAPGSTFPIGDPLVEFNGTNTIFVFVNDGSWPNGDLVIGGSNPAHNVRFSAIPSCTTPTDGPFSIQMETDMVRFVHAPEEWRDTVTMVRVNQAKTYAAPEGTLLFNSPQTFIPNSDTVSWRLRVLNTTNYAGVDKTLRNSWFAIEKDPAVTIVAIRDITDPTAVFEYNLLDYADGTGHWITLGQIAAFSSRSLEVIGLYGDCEPQALVARTGASCWGYPDPDPGAGYLLAGEPFVCELARRDLLIDPVDISLAVQAESPPAPLPLCEELDYAVHVSNLQLPTAYEHMVSMQLPPGVTIVAGSSQLEYPAGSGNVLPLLDPALTGGTSWQWDLSADPNGLVQLPGVDRAPLNQYRILFRILTDCSLTAGVRIGLRAEGRNFCGTIRGRTAFTERLLIEGVPAINNQYGLEMEVPEGSLQACDSTLITGQLLHLGPFPSTAIEFAVVDIPAGFSLVENTLTGPLTYTEETVFNDRRSLQLAIPPGTDPEETLDFSFYIRDDRTEEWSCTEEYVALSTVISTQVGCSLVPSDSCQIQQLLNTDTLWTTIAKDEFSLAIDQVESELSADQLGEWVNLSFVLSNLQAENARTDSMIWEVYWDANNSGSWEPGDLLLYNTSPEPFHLEGLTTWPDEISFYAANDQLCQLILVGRSSGPSCFCEPLVSVPIPAPVVRNAGPPVTLCSGEPLLLGVDDREQGFSFFWEGLPATITDSLLSPGNSQTLFSAQNNGDLPTTYTYLLMTERPGGCLSQDTVTVTVMPQIRGSITAASDYNGQTISCAGAADGSIAVQMEVGEAPFTYALDSTSQSQPVFSALSAGQVTILVIDSRGCSTPISYELEEPDSLLMNLTGQPISCFGGADGMISAQVTGGTPTYSYNWSHDSAEGGNTLTDLAAGWYELTVTDANDCILTDSIWLDQAPELLYSTSVDSTSCHYTNDGQAALSLTSGGSPPFTVNWDNAVSDTLYNALTIGWHDFVIADAAGCLITDSVYVPGPLPITAVSVEENHVSCAGGNDGSLIPVLSGGTGAYAYQWNTQATTAQLDQLPAGSYTLTVTDANNCVYPLPAWILTEPELLVTETVLQEHISCYGFADGSIAVDVLGGTQPYSLQWDSGAQSAQLNNLTAGDYQLVVTDANACITDLLITLTEPDPLVIELATEPPPCSDDLGRVELMPFGGTPPYQYRFSGMDEQAIPVAYLPEGVHLAQVFDANNCTEELVVTIEAPLPIQIELPEQVEVNYGDTISVLANVLDARGDLVFNWTPDVLGISCADCPNPVFDLENSTVFYLEVTDAFDCEALARLPVIVRRPRRLYIPNIFSPNGDQINDLLFPFAASEVVQINRFQVFDRWGELVYQADNFPPNDPAFGWDGQFRGRDMPSAVYVYWLEASFTDGAVLFYQGDFSLIR